MDRKSFLKKQRVYTIGYLIAAALTLFVYSAVIAYTWTTTTLAIIALVAAVLQLLVQTKFFLHVKLHGRGAWKLYSYVFTWLMMIIVVVGSLWVMMNLNYNMHMTPGQMLERIEKENKKGF
ncbi:MAG: hypothetical protein WBP12_01305 [Candidatus Saccharimonas sp.]